MKANSLLISDLEQNAKTQARVATDDEAVDAYATALKEGAQLPAIDVFHDGESYYIADGWHRMRAHVQAAEDFIDARVHEGGEREAVLYAAGANTTHGVRRTNADKRRAVQILLEDSVWGKWSSRAIAEHCGVHHDMVEKLRNQLAESASSTEKRVGRDGKKRASTKAAATKPEDQLADSASCDEAEELEGDDAAEWIEEHAEPYRACVKDLAASKAALNAVRSRMDEVAQDAAVGAHLKSVITPLRSKCLQAVSEIDAVRPLVNQMTPVCVCEDCNGDGCEKCLQTGFWTKAIADDKRKAAQ